MVIDLPSENVTFAEMRIYQMLKPFMRRLIRQIVCCIFFLFGSMGAQTVGGQDQSAIRHTLPKDPKEVVIRLDFRGGQTPRQNADPHLVITADGTVLIGAPYGISKPIRSTISQEEIQAILRFAIDENRFFDFDAQKVKAEVSAAAVSCGRSLAIADASTISIRIQADGKDYTVEYYGLTLTARQYPDIRELQQLKAIQKRLQHLMSVIRSGGKQNLEEYLKAANAHLRQKFPKMDPLGIGDLEYPNLLAPGRSSYGS